MMTGKSMVINMTTISTNRNGIFCFTIFSVIAFDMPIGRSVRRRHGCGPKIGYSRQLAAAPSDAQKE